MRLRRPCEHDRYEPHTWMPGMWENTLVDCPGGEFITEDALVIEKENGEWPDWTITAIQQAHRTSTDSAERILDALADQVGEPG